MIRQEWSKPLADLTLRATPLAAELFVDAKRILHFLIVCQENPCIAVHLTTGVQLPAHERTMLDLAHRGASQNVFIGSRGTSKTATIGALYHTYKSMFFSKRRAVTINATGFRGGQLIFEDIEKLAKGAWADQEGNHRFLLNSMLGEKPVKRAQNYWSIEWSSLSSSLTVPTNDPEKIRGIRAHDLYVDEANFADNILIDVVITSFLNVLQDFKTGGEAAASNNVYYTTTVDYGWRDFLKNAQGTYEALRWELEALAAAKKQDWETFDRLYKKGLHKTSWIMVDYTDTIMRRTVTNREGTRFKVKWPDKTRKWRHDQQGIPYTERDEEGRMKQEGTPCEVITTYPINRGDMEGKLLRGESSEAVWLSEQRNVVDQAAGDVYPHAIVDRAVCKAGRFVLAYADCPADWKAAYKADERNYQPNVSWSCTDPCVIGVDYAPGSRDFSAIVVIRVGPLATGAFNPMTGTGYTKWSNVIWCEQHRHASGANVAEKLRALAERYNLVYFHDPYETDDWRLCRAIGLDCRGGGNTVRDELVFINDQIVPAGQYRIFDPLDPDPRVQAFKTDASAKPMLDAIMPTGQLNDKMVEFTIAQLENALLYLPADLNYSQRSSDRKVDIAFDGARTLEHQLRALQQNPTAAGYRTFFMTGDTAAVVNKKDFWAAFLYGAKQLRAHILRARLIEDTPPPLGALVTKIGGRSSAQYAKGSRRW